MNKTLNKCPVCGGDLQVTRLHCRHCDTTIEGNFSMPVGPLAGLTPEQVQFLLAFVRNEGRFTRLEQEMNLSYPTLRNRLYEIIRALGFEPSKGEEQPVRLTEAERKQVLMDISTGKITAAEGQRRLSGKQ